MNATWYRRRLIRQFSIQRRRLLAESLEQRYLLAGDALQNPDNPNDVNDDTRVSAIDALIIVNSMTRDANAASAGGEGETAATSSKQYYLDTSGDGSVTAKDALRVINALAEGEELGGYTVDEDETLTVPIADLLGDTSGAMITAVNGFSVDSDLFLSRKGGSLSFVFDPVTGNFSYSPLPNFNGSDWFTITRTTPEDVNTLTIPISVNPVNDPPVISVPETQTVSEDSTVSISGITVSDIDSDELTVDLSVDSGVLSAGGQIGSTISVPPSALSGLTYSPNQDFDATDTITINASDEDNTDTDTVGITVNAVNDPPLIVAPPPQQFFTDFNNRLSVMPTVVDVDSELVIELNFTLSAGVMRAPEVVGQVTVTGNATGSLTYSGFRDDVFDAIEETKFNFGSPGERTLTITVDDQDSINPLTATETVDITVTDENFLQKPNQVHIGFENSLTFRDIAVKEIPGITDQGPIRLTISAFNPVLQDFFGDSVPGATEGLIVLDDRPENFRIEGTRDAINNALNGASFSIRSNAFAAPEGNLVNFVISTVDDASFVRFGSILVNPLDSSVSIAGNNDYASTDEETPTFIDVLVNDYKRDPSLPAMVTEVEGQDVSGGQTVILPSGAVVSSDGTGIDYSPDNDFFGTDTFTYIISDDALEPLFSSAAVTIDVTPINDLPIAIDDSPLLDLEDSSQTIDVLANDDVGGGELENEVDKLAITNVTDPPNGTATIDNRGTGDPSDDLIVYTPDPFFDGDDTFTYTIEDTGGSIDEGTVNIFVVNVPQGAQDDSGLIMREDDILSVIEVTANDDIDGIATISEINGNPIAVGGSTSTSNGGTVELNSGNTLTYTPADDFFGLDTFTYTITDEGGNPVPDDTAVVTIDVAPVNDPPTANPDTESTPKDTPLTFSIENLFINDDIGPSNESGQTLTLTLLSNDVPGSTVLYNSDGTLTYTPPPDFVGDDTFTYTITDDGLTGDVIDPQLAFSTVTIDVGGFDDIVAIDDGPFLFNEDSAPQTIDVLANDSVFDPPDTDPEITQIDGNDVGTGQSVTTGNGSSVTNNGSSITYTPAADLFGDDDFTYTISNGLGSTDSATVDVTIAPVNDGPINSIPGPTTLFNTETLAFTNNEFQVNDVDSDQLEVNIQVDAFNGARLRLDPLPGDVDVDGNDTNQLIISGLQSSINVALGNLVYDPFDDFVGTDILLINTSDGDLSDEDSVRITVTPPQVPFASPDLFIVSEDSVPSELPVKDNDVVPDPDAQPPNRLTITALNGDGLTGSISVSTDRGGTIRYDADTDSFIYTPAPDFNGFDSFDYTIESTPDPGDGPSTANVTIEVTPVNDGPINSIPGGQMIDEDNDLIFSDGDFSISDPDGDVDVQVNLQSLGGLGTIIVPTTPGVSQTNPNSGNVTLDGTVSAINNALNGLTYSPNLNDNGSDTLQISTNDLGNVGGGALTDNDTVNITIEPVNDGPINTIPGPSTLFNTDTLSFTIGEFSVADVDASELEVNLTVGQGTVALGSTSGLQVEGNNSPSLTATGSMANLNNGLGSLVYDPVDSFIGSDTLTMTTSDLGGSGAGGILTDTDTVSITVTPPEVPFAASDLFDVEEDSSTTNLDILSNDLKPDPDPGQPDNTLRITQINGQPAGSTGQMFSTPNNSTITFLGNSVSYLPAPDFFGTDTFTYTIESTPDIGDGPSTGTVWVEVTPINDGPINSVPGPLSIDEDNNLSFSGANLITVQDIDAGLDGVTVTLTVGNGMINVPTGGGANVTGNGGGNVSIDGTVNQVNSTLGGLTYSPDLNFNGFDQLSISTNDNGNTGGGALSDNDTVDITVAPINDPPVIVVPGQQSFLTDFDNTFSNANQNALQISDVDVDNTDDDVEVDLMIADGALTLSDTSKLDVIGNGGNWLRIRGSVSNINASLGGGLTYNTSVDGSKTLLATVNDLGNLGDGGPLSDSGSIDIEVFDIPPVDIIGQIFVDLSADENKDSNEPGIEGVEVRLSGRDFQGNSVNSFDTTDSLGNYSFLGLRPNGNQPYVITQVAPKFLQVDALEDKTVDLRGREGSIELRTPVPFTDFKAEFVPTFNLFGATQNASGIDIAIFDSKQMFAMFVGDGWDTNRFSNARLAVDDDGNSAVLSVFDSQAGADRTANVAVQAGTLTYRGNGADRVYRVIGGSELLGLVSEAVDQVLLLDI